jgi:RPA43 OB domain in RNA Pol I
MVSARTDDADEKPAAAGGSDDADDTDPRVKGEDGEEEAQAEEEDMGCWIDRLTGEPIGGVEGKVEFTVVGLTVANSMLSVHGSLLEDDDTSGPLQSSAISTTAKEVEQKQKKKNKRDSEIVVLSAPVLSLQPTPINAADALDRTGSGDDGEAVANKKAKSKKNKHKTTTEDNKKERDPLRATAAADEEDEEVRDRHVDDVQANMVTMPALAALADDVEEAEPSGATKRKLPDDEAEGVEGENNRTTKKKKKKRKDKGEWSGSTRLES